MNNKEEGEDYDVCGTWYIEGKHFHRNEYLGVITMIENATIIDMPEELEINGFIYELKE